MNDVVLMYAEDNRKAAAEIAKALKNQGLNVHFRNPAGPAGKLAEAFDKADCVVSLWSSEALRDSSFLAMSRLADRRRLLVSATLDGTTPPGDFEMRQAVNLGRQSIGSLLSDPAPLMQAVRDATTSQAPAQNSSRDAYLRSFVEFCGLQFGNTLDDAVSLYGLPNASNDTTVTYVHNGREGPGILAVHAFDDQTKLITFVLAYGGPSVAFLAEHKITDPNLAFIGKHKDEVFRKLGAPSVSLGPMEDGTVAFGYDTRVIIQATAPDGETARFGLVIGVVFLMTSRDTPFCCGMSVQWVPVHLSDLDVS